VGRFLIWLSGADPELLSAHRVDRARYIGVATAILTTGVMAAVSMWFALRTALNVPTRDAIPFAAGWALIIMALDRWLVTSIRRRDGWKVGKYLLAASPRVAMAVLFGVLISTPLTLRVFQPEIQYHLTSDQQQEALEYEHSSARTQLMNAIARDESTVAAMNLGINGGSQVVDVAADPTYQNEERQLVKDQGRQQFYYDQWQCQLYGIQEPGGPKCIAGDGSLAGASGNSYAQAAQQVTQDEKNLAAREQYLAEQSKNRQDATKTTDAAELPNAKRTLADDEAELNQDNTNSANSIKANTGLLARLDALNQAADASALLRTFQILLFLFFMIVDCLPVLVKITHNLGDKDEYEEAADRTKADRLAISAAASKTRVATAAAEADADQQIKLAALQRRVARKTHDGTRRRRATRRWRRTAWPGWLGLPGSVSATGTPEIFLQEFRPGAASGSHNGHPAGPNPGGRTTGP
jgi:Domain of unknown function (DUF4407)